MSKYEVTNFQYVEFLNQKAAVDPYGLYDTQMGSLVHGGITRSGSDGSYSYVVKPGYADKPVVLVSFYDTLRFANWLHNGQGVGNTETGAYTITASGISNNDIIRNSGAQYFLPTEDEWYKAAYFDASTVSFLDYSAGSNLPMTCGVPTGAPNSGNCSTASGEWIVGSVTDVGSYLGSASPWGTFDQGGNAWEWVETATSQEARGVRGGSFHENSNLTSATHRNNDFLPQWNSWDVGFRLAAPIPEPSTALLLGLGLAGIAAARRRRVS
jgi:formylglycine-generating enzyme required for sulfatase activity